MEVTEYDFGGDRMVEKNMCGRPQLVCWGSIVKPYGFGTKALLLFGWVIQ